LADLQRKEKQGLGPKDRNKEQGIRYRDKEHGMTKVDRRAEKRDRGKE
jgi:hypothetical protein